MRLGLITTAHGRPALTRLMADYYARLEPEGITLFPVVAYTNKEDVHNLHFLWTTVQAPNNPRSDKWNAAARRLRHAQVDAVMIIGSDDFVHPGYIEQACRRIARGDHYITPTSCTFYDWPTGRLMDMRFDRIGAGRVLSRAACDLVDWTLWLPGQNRNCDWALGQQAGANYEAHYFHSPLASGCPILDVKTDVNIWSFDHLAQRTHGHPLRAQPFFERFFPMLAPTLLGPCLTST